MNGDLLDLVDQLTQPEHQHLAQKDDFGKWLKAHTVTHPPLLVRMREAVHPSSEKNGGSASSASTRAPADLEALFQYAKITATIGDWCRMVGAARHREPAAALRAWYVAFKVRAERDNLDDAFYHRTLSGWVAMIRNHLDPPESFTVQAPCPICSVSAYGNEFDGGDLWPIEVRYRKDEMDRMVDEIAVCRAPECRTVWMGHAAVIELAEEVNEKIGTDPDRATISAPYVS